jgi:hypothetical protein
MDFFACRLVSGRWLKSGGDQDPAELAGHVRGRWPDLGGVPGGAGAVAVHVGGVVPGGGVPGDGDALAGELEGDGAADRLCCPVAGLPGAEDLFRVFYRGLNLPPVIPVKLGNSPTARPDLGRY